MIKINPNLFGKTAEAFKRHGQWPAAPKEKLHGWISLHTSLRVKRKPETDEWVVVWTHRGKRDEGKTYYTNDKADAIATMKAIVRQHGAADMFALSDAKVAELRERSR